MTQPPDGDALRAGNADREQVVGQLNSAFAEGRLEVAELEERVAAAYAAKTLGDLRPLTADLPTTGTVARSRPPGSPAARSSGSGQVRPASGQHSPQVKGSAAGVAAMTGVLMLNVLIWGIISLSTRELIYFWPVWLLIPLFFTVVGYVSSRRN